MDLPGRALKRHITVVKKFREDLYDPKKQKLDNQIRIITRFLRPHAQVGTI